RRPPRPPLFPYTTLFRSQPPLPPPLRELDRRLERVVVPLFHTIEIERHEFERQKCRRGLARQRVHLARRLYIMAARERAYSGERSEEHTSELQSLRHLVC